MRDIAHTRARYGYRRLYVLLKRDGWRIGKNQMYRLYREKQLQLRSKLPKRRKMVVVRRERVRPRGATELWSLDFVFDQLADGRRFRTLTVVDVFSREALAIEVGQRLGGEHVVAVLNRLAARAKHRSTCSLITAANSRDACLICGPYHCNAKIDFSRPGKPTDNCYVETFQRSLRDECLNLHWFEAMEDAKATIEAWRRDYNETRLTWLSMTSLQRSTRVNRALATSKTNSRNGPERPSGSASRHPAV